MLMMFIVWLCRSSLVSASDRAAATAPRAVRVCSRRNHVQLCAVTRISTSDLFCTNYHHGQIRAFLGVNSCSRQGGGVHFAVME